MTADFLTRYYRRSSLALQRIESISKSPIFSHFAETLNGVDSIRAYDLGEQFIAENKVWLAGCLSRGESVDGVWRGGKVSVTG